MSCLDRWLCAALWAAIPHYDHEDEVPPVVARYIEWVYEQPPECWAALTGCTVTPAR